MKHFIIILLLLAAIPAKSYAWFDKWNLRDISLHLTGQTLLTIDMIDTKYSLDHHKYVEEQNPILGKHPSDKRYYIYNYSMMAIHTAVAVIIPSKFRPIWETAWIGGEAFAVFNNWTIHGGIHLKF
jgi:hypothetical protein